MKTKVNLLTGYFADEKSFTKVHIVKDGKPVCGAQVGRNKQFMFNANGVIKGYLECENCKKNCNKIVKENSSL